MTGLLRTLRFVGLLAVATVSGLTLSHVLQSPGSSALDGRTWLLVQHTFYGGFAVVGGTAEILGLAATAGDAVLSRRRGRGALPPAVAALCLAGTLVAYFVGNRPVNARVAAWTPTSLPPDWPSYRNTWETAHAVSAVLSGIALVVLLAATIGRRGEIAPPSRRL
jgi:hypothetical protein